MGGEREYTHLGVTMIGKWLTRSRITSKAAEPGPIIIPARTSVTGTLPLRNSRPVSRREVRCSDWASLGTSPPR